MISLFIDTSLNSLSFAICKDEKLLASTKIKKVLKQSSVLMDTIINNLKAHDIDKKDIDNIIVLNGPGSFTGVRLGVTVAKTLAWSLGINLYLLSNLEALAIHSESKNKLAVIYDKKDYSYVGIYNDNKFEGYTYVNDLLEIDSGEIIAFETNDFIDEMLKQNCNFNLKYINEYDYLKVINYALKGKPCNVHLAEPVYLKKIDAEKKLEND